MTLDLPRMAKAVLGGLVGVFVSTFIIGWFPA